MPEEDNEQGTIRYVRCPTCGMPNPATSAACFRCGNSMQAEVPGPAPRPKAAQPSSSNEIICAKCKKALPPGSKFCGFCGTPLPARAPAPARAPERAVEVSPPAPATPPVAPSRKPYSAAKPEVPPPVAAVVPPVPLPQAPAPAPKKASQSTPTVPTPVPSPQGTQVFSGLHVPKIDASIVEIKADDSPGKTTRIVKETFVGRGTCDVSYPNDALLSLRHASLGKREGKLVLKDLESQNGTFVKQRQDSELTPGDVFVLGRELFRFATQRLDEAPQNVMGTVVMAGAPKLQPGPITAKLEHIQLSGEVIKEYSLEKPETTIGRTTGDLVFGDDPYMSGTHARIVAQPGRFILQDLKSRNGIYRRIRDSMTLQDGDEFFLGEERFRVDIKLIED
jgi:pSer/pThr/pTyr-binding forkhead associated (FHA) protein